jgi:hypothetical protein
MPRTPTTTAQPAGMDILSRMMQLPPLLMAAWHRQNDPQHYEWRIAEAQASAGAVLSQLEPGDRRAVEAGFHALPETAQAVILDEISDDGDYDVELLDEDEIEILSCSEEGSLLTVFWGDDAADNWSRVIARIGTISDVLPPEERGAAWAFFEALPSRGKIATLCLLAEG